MPTSPKDSKLAVFPFRKDLSNHNPYAEREDIVNMVFDLVQRLLPEDADGMPPEIEHHVAHISRAISEALGIPPD
jgi:hypothetical protein